MIPNHILLGRFVAGSGTNGGLRVAYFNLKPGTTLGRNYFVVEQLGDGWEGEVYKVEERRTGVLRAAKIFYESRRLTPAQLRRYTQKMYRLRFCPLVTQYHHRDVARVGRESVEILVSDFVEGEMLSDFLARQPKKRLTSFEALHLLYALAVGLEPVHYKGEYHGDLHVNNVMVKRVGLGFDVHLIDFFDLGKSSRDRVRSDVIDLISLLYTVMGGKSGYAKSGPEIRQIVNGRKRGLISQKFKTAGQLRIALENMEW
ncbi:MAG: protein kinase [candidate division Zixibacteria bacterium]|nr:protein kinase [candidate division Zixibacteria bacterium]